jgi:hypothetical protein
VTESFPKISRKTKGNKKFKVLALRYCPKIGISSKNRHFCSKSRNCVFSPEKVYY